MTIIRPETEGDYATIEAVLLDAFDDGPVVVEMVRNIRASDTYRPELALVAEADGVVAGYVMFSVVQLVGERTWDVASLSPLGVVPPLHRSGIGSQLVRHALEICERTEWPLSVVLGIPEYYPRFGYDPAWRHGITTELIEDPRSPAFMMRPLRTYDPDCRGKVVYPSFTPGAP